MVVETSEWISTGISLRLPPSPFQFISNLFSEQWETTTSHRSLLFGFHSHFQNKRYWVLFQNFYLMILPFVVVLHLVWFPRNQDKLLRKVENLESNGTPFRFSDALPFPENFLFLFSFRFTRFLGNQTAQIESYGLFSFETREIPDLK